MVALTKALRKHYSRLGKIGAKARNEKLTPARRSEIAQQAANERWARVAEERLELDRQSAPQEVTS